MHVPQGFGVVTPYILVEGAGDYARFLADGLGGEEIGRSVAPDGRIANLQMQFAGTTIMMSESSDQFPPGRSAFYLYVADADAAVARAVAAGAESIMDVGDMPYGDRQGGVRDPAGNIWWLSQRLTAEPYSF